MLLAFGPDDKSEPAILPQGSITIFGAPVGYDQLILAGTVIVVVAALTAVYTVLSVAHYETAGAGSWDLGMFTEVIKQYAHFHSPIDDIKSPGYDLLGDHFHPIIALLGPFFLLFPSPITLLVGQAFLFSLAAAPIIWLGRDRISAGRNRCSPSK